MFRSIHDDPYPTSLHNAVHNVSGLPSTNEINRLDGNYSYHNSGYTTLPKNMADLWREQAKSRSYRCDHDPPIHYDPVRDREGKALSIIALMAVVAVLSVMVIVSDLGNWLYVLMG